MYPDIVELLLNKKQDFSDIKSYIIDSEIVGFDILK